MRKLLILLLLLACACTRSPSGSLPDSSSGDVREGQIAQVTRVIDGDTIDVQVDGVQYRVRYIGMNTPERNEACFREASDANAALVSGKTVTLVKDTSETDVYGRLLRYVYAGGTFINEELVREGWAENAVYPPDTKYAAVFHQLEVQARTQNIGCHPTGIFNDGSDTR